MADFIARFHNIGGSTPAEHHRNFNFYLNDLQKNTTIDLDEFFRLLKPKNRQEEIFRIAMLHRFKRHQELLQVLQNGDHIHCLKVIKDMSFFDNFNTISARVFVDEICPNISFSIRLKVLNRLSVIFTDCDRARDYFECVKDRYGLKVAKVLLVACSEEFVKKAVTDYDLSFNQRHLVRLHHKYPGFVRFYFDHHVGFSHKNQFLGRYLALHDADTFSFLVKKAAVKAGTAGYTKYLSSEENRKDFLNNPKYYVDFMTNRLPFKVLSIEEYQQFLLKLLPESPDSLGYDYKFIQYLKCVPYKVRGKVLFEVFKERYGFEMYSSVDYIEKNLLKEIDADSASKFNFDEDYIEFMPIEKSIPLIKEMIENTEDKDGRAELLEKLVQTCSFHKSNDALLDVLKYFCTRHKNAISQIRSKFAYALMNGFKLERLSLEHWSYISTIIKLFEINLEDEYCLSSLCQSYVHFKYLNKLDYTHEAKILGRNSCYVYSLYDDQPKLAHDYFVTLLGVLKDIGKNEEEHKKYSLETLNKIIYFNIRHKKYYVDFSLYKHLLDAVEDDPQKNYVNVDWLLSGAGRSSVENREYLLDHVAKMKMESFSYEHFKRFLKYRHDLLLKYIDHLFKNQPFVDEIAYNLSKMQYVQIYHDLVNYAMSVIESEELEVDKFTSSLIILAYCKPEALKPVVEKYQPPKDGKINVHGENMKDILTVQKWLLKCFKFVSKPVDVVPLLLTFCKGDYNSVAADTVHTVLAYLPEKHTMGVVSTLKIKEQIRLTNFITSTKIRNELIMNLLNTENKSSVKKLIFDKLKTNLQSERTQFEFDLVKRNISLVDPSNKESLATLTTVSNIPKFFYAEYVELIWNYLKSFKKSYEIDLIANVQSKQLNEALTREIITTSLFKVDKKKRQAVLDFTKEAVLNLPSLIDTIPLNEPVNDPKGLYELIESICGEVLTRSKRPQEEKVKVADAIYAQTSNDALITHMLSITHFWVHLTPRKDLPPLSSCTTPPPMQSLASFLIRQVKKIVEKYTKVSIEYHALFLKSFLKNVVNAEEYDNENLKYTELAALMLDEDDSEEVRLFALGLVSFDEYKNPRINEFQAKIKEKVRSEASELVKLRLACCYYTCNGCSYEDVLLPQMRC